MMHGSMYIKLSNILSWRDSFVGLFANFIKFGILIFY